MELAFSKMQGIGNDFVLIDDRGGAIEKAVPYDFLSRKICDRNFGIGGDGLIVISESRSCDLKFSIYNQDGSQPEMCGNGMRCFAKLAYESGAVDKERLAVETLAGVIRPEVIVGANGSVDAVRVDMGCPEVRAQQVPFLSELAVAISDPLALPEGVVAVTAVSMGNPHAVVFVEDLAGIDVRATGPAIETHARFPEGTNVEFIEVMGRSEMRMQVWERGVGVTLACGTGACAALVAASLNKKTGDQATVHLAGGDLLIEWDRESGHIFKTGPAAMVFSGTMVV